MSIDELGRILPSDGIHSARCWSSFAMPTRPVSAWQTRSRNGSNARSAIAA